MEVLLQDETLRNLLLPLENRLAAALFQSSGVRAKRDPRAADQQRGHTRYRDTYLPKNMFVPEPQIYGAEE